MTNGAHIRRFDRPTRILHIVVMTAFLGLAALFGRYSLRTVLVATTLLTAILGLAVYMAKMAVPRSNTSTAKVGLSLVDDPLRLRLGALIVSSGVEEAAVAAAVQICGATRTLFAPRHLFAKLERNGCAAALTAKDDIRHNRLQLNSHHGSVQEDLAAHRFSDARLRRRQDSADALLHA